MNLRTKAILINASMVATLLFEYRKGSRLLSLAIAGVLVFAVVNIMMFISAKK